MARPCECEQAFEGRSSNRSGLEAAGESGSYSVTAGRPPRHNRSRFALRPPLPPRRRGGRRAEDTTL